MKDDEKEIGNTIYEVKNHPCFSRAIEEKNCIFTEIMLTADMGIIIFNVKEKKVVFWNEKAIKFVTAKINSGKELWELFEANILKEKFPDSNKKIGKLIIKDKLIHFSMFGTPHYHWVFLEDITEKTRMEAIAQEINYLNSMAGIFSSIRHEIANPLVSAKVSLSVLKKRLENLSKKEVLDYINRIEETMGKLEELVASLKNFNIFNKLELKPIDINDFLVKETNLLTHQFVQEDIKIKLQLTNKNPLIQGNKGALRQIFLNLVLNAIDALKNTPEPEIEISTNIINKKVNIIVSNNGEEIDNKTQSRIFEPFFTTKSKGSGLGLAIIKKLTLMMNGEISLTSNKEKTSFTLSFPVIIEKQESKKNIGANNETEYFNC